MNKYKFFVTISLLLLILSGCYRPPITLRVLDEQTKKPIEGAVAIAWWDSTHGLPGLYYHKTAEVAERVSDLEGNIKLPSFSTQIIPQIRVYKQGYVGWHNFEIYRGILFNDIKRARRDDRRDFIYRSQDIYLERWKKEYSHISHQYFLTCILPTDHEDIDNAKSLFLRTFDKYELPLIRKEREMLKNIIKNSQVEPQKTKPKENKKVEAIESPKAKCTSSRVSRKRQGGAAIITHGYETLCE